MNKYFRLFHSHKTQSQARILILSKIDLVVKCGILVKGWQKTQREKYI